MNWDHFNQKIFIFATKEKLYNAFATSGGMESWFLRSCDYSRNGEIISSNMLAETGDEYTFLWHGWPDETVEKGKILAANNIDVFEFTFDGNGSTNMIVKITLEDFNDGTLINLHQYNIPTTDEGKYNWHLGCKTGWNFYLTNLKAILEHNVDLRNKDVSMKSVLNC